MKTMKNMKQSRFILFVLSFLVMSVGNVYAQNVTVTGTVLDSTGEPVIGANVKSGGEVIYRNHYRFRGEFLLVGPCGHEKNWKSVISVCFHKRLSLSRELR